MSSAFIQAAIILLREGLEAMLVIAALAAYLTKAGAAHRIGALYGGALAAVGASIIGRTGPTTRWRRTPCGRSARSPAWPCSAKVQRPWCSSTRWRPPKAAGV